ncbi:hypothetical protein H7J93_19290 [Mycobacterium barrassiae]|uniref:hypothetical protein n=1 Tax=Mycobacterium barrassiae TaxID=319709 RepID=UPI00226585B1|nr:hypothetical protein [Mycobacterium barrassiae]MCV7301772.1 hypothetical protein [Mycobacterium barrassiae]
MSRRQVRLARRALRAGVSKADPGASMGLARVPRCWVAVRLALRRRQVDPQRWEFGLGLMARRVPTEESVPV